MIMKHIKDIGAISVPVLVGAISPWIDGLLNFGLILEPWRKDVVLGAYVFGGIFLVAHYLIYRNAPAKRLKRNLKVTLIVFVCTFVICFTLKHTIDQVWSPDGAALVAVWWVWKAAFVLMTCSVCVFLSCAVLIGFDKKAQDIALSEESGSQDQSNESDPG